MKLSGNILVLQTTSNRAEFTIDATRCAESCVTFLGDHHSRGQVAEETVSTTGSRASSSSGTVFEFVARRWARVARRSYG